MSKSSQNLILIVLLICSISAKIDNKEFQVEFEHGDDIEILSKFDDYFDLFNNENVKVDPYEKMDIVKESYEDLYEQFENLQYSDIPEDYAEMYKDLLDRYQKISEDYESIQSEVDALNKTEFEENTDYLMDDAAYELSNKVSKITKLEEDESYIATKLCKYYLTLGLLTAISKESTIIVTQNKSV